MFWEPGFNMKKIILSVTSVVFGTMAYVMVGIALASVS